jgi:hypothetical protein
LHWRDPRARTPDIKDVAASARSPRSREHGAGAPRRQPQDVGRNLSMRCRQPLNVVGNRRKQGQCGGPGKEVGGRRTEGLGSFWIRSDSGSIPTEGPKGESKLRVSGRSPTGIHRRVSTRYSREPMLEEWCQGLKSDTPGVLLETAEEIRHL